MKSTNYSAIARKYSLKISHVLCFALLTSQSSAQGTAITPTSGFTNAYRFTYTGANQTFTIPSGVTSISVKIWGAGGGGSNLAGFYSTGGAGGYVSGTVTVVPGTTYSVLVGGGGRSDGSSAWATHAFGFGGIATGQSLGSNGGGLAGLFTGNTTVTAANMARAVMVAGGGGGGEDGNTAGTLLANGGQGGDASHSGGQVTMAGGDNTAASGGGGGGGYQGGNTNLTRLSNSAVTMGEGGSNYLAPGVTGGVSNSTTDLGLVFTTGNLNDPPNTSDPQYLSGSGVGTYVTTSGIGGNGLMIIQYSTVPLPLTLLSFKTVTKDNYALLEWQTADENSIDGFQIERSIDGINFTPISANIPAGSPSNIYSFQDQFTHPGENYYRLKMLDQSGSFSYSQINRINVINTASPVIRIFPNPGSNNITFNGLSEKAEVQIFSTDGSLVKHFKAPVEQVDITGLATGFYFIEIAEQGHINFRLRYVKQ